MKADHGILFWIETKLRGALASPDAPGTFAAMLRFALNAGDAPEEATRKALAHFVFEVLGVDPVSGEVTENTPLQPPASKPEEIALTLEAWVEEDRKATPPADFQAEAKAAQDTLEQAARLIRAAYPKPGSFAHGGILIVHPGALDPEGIDSLREGFKAAADAEELSALVVEKFPGSELFQWAGGRWERLSPSEDSARLDWLQDNRSDVTSYDDAFIITYYTETGSDGMGPTLREAIDDARAKQTSTNPET